MKNRIYFIGGASASGKSTIAKELSNLYSIPIIELDRFYDTLALVIADRELLVEAAKKVAIESVKQLLELDVCCIIEGGWIQPKQASKLQDKSKGLFYPAYCGYPKANIESRYLEIKKDGSHWLKIQSRKAVRSFLTTQIKESAYYRKECKKLQIDFFDFTDFSEGSQALRAHFAKWFRGC